MRAFWNERYRQVEYIYGKTPNAFLEARLPTVERPGRALFPAEGEGRNAVFVASRGWKVDAFDYSETGREKALMLAREAGVRIHYEVCELREYAFPTAAYQMVGLFFAHQPPAERAYLHRKAWESLQPGGAILLEAFGKRQLQFESGGPKQEDMLYSKEELRSDFPDMEILLLEERETDLSEGLYHNGRAHVVRLHGQKPLSTE